MSADYANATIANAAAVAGTFPSGTPAVQPPIGVNVANPISGSVNQWSGHIGLSTTKVATAAEMATNPVNPNTAYPASPGTPARGPSGGLNVWATCVAGCAAGATGTLTGSTFVAGAGADQALGAIPANGYGWVADN